jgi:hypothetical protein
MKQKTKLKTFVFNNARELRDLLNQMEEADLETAYIYSTSSGEGYCTGTWCTSEDHYCLPICRINFKN